MRSHLSRFSAISRTSCVTLLSPSVWSTAWSLSCSWSVSLTPSLGIYCWECLNYFFFRNKLETGGPTITGNLFLLCLNWGNQDVELSSQSRLRLDWIGGKAIASTHKMFTCADCNTLFKRLCDLAKHRRIHCNYHCSACNNFSTNNKDIF